MYAIPNKEIPSLSNSFRDLRKLIFKYKLRVRTIGIGRTKKRVIEDIKQQLPLKIVNDSLCYVLSFFNAKERINLMYICKQFKTCASNVNQHDPNLTFLIVFPLNSTRIYIFIFIVFEKCFFFFFFCFTMENERIHQN